jgi:hypothetical protein
MKKALIKKLLEKNIKETKREIHSWIQVLIMCEELLAKFNRGKKK